MLIFERIREELRNGKTAKMAVDAGYGKAFLTFLDSNVTTLIAALFPVRLRDRSGQGLAVTLTSASCKHVHRRLRDPDRLRPLCTEQGKISRISV